MVLAGIVLLLRPNLIKMRDSVGLVRAMRKLLLALDLTQNNTF